MTDSNDSIPEPPACRIEAGSAADLDAVNAVIQSAVMGWSLPERVKRLSLPLYRYDAIDLGHLDLVLARAEGKVVGVATWEPAASRDLPEATRGLLLHGLYVRPEWQKQGIGRRLLEAAREAARTAGMNGILVKAQAEARGFFEGAGFIALPVRDSERDYAHRYWWPLA